MSNQVDSKPDFDLKAISKLPSLVCPPLYRHDPLMDVVLIIGGHDASAEPERTPRWLDQTLALPRGECAKQFQDAIQHDRSVTLRYPLVEGSNFWGATHTLNLAGFQYLARYDLDGTGFVERHEPARGTLRMRALPGGFSPRVSVEVLQEATSRGKMNDLIAAMDWLRTLPPAMGATASDKAVLVD